MLRNQKQLTDSQLHCISFLLWLHNPQPFLPIFQSVQWVIRFWIFFDSQLKSIFLSAQDSCCCWKTIPHVGLLSWFENDNTSLTFVLNLNENEIRNMITES
jgi:hypothetical protein